MHGNMEGNFVLRSVRKQEKIQKKGTSYATVKKVQLHSCRSNGTE